MNVTIPSVMVTVDGKKQKVSLVIKRSHFKRIFNQINKASGIKKPTAKKATVSSDGLLIPSVQTPAMAN
jgi:hypothetical protein